VVVDSLSELMLDRRESKLNYNKKKRDCIFLGLIILKNRRLNQK